MGFDGNIELELYISDFCFSQAFIILLFIYSEYERTVNF